MLLAPPAEAGEVAPPALALGVELRQRVRRGGSRWAPVHVESASPRGLHQHGREVMVGLRPLERSTRSDAWIKGSVSWEALRRPGHGYAPAQARWFTELYSIARDMRLFGSFSDVSEWVTLDDVESQLLWPHLGTAPDHGILLVPTKKHTTIRVARDAGIVVRAERSAEALELTARISIDEQAVDAGEVRPIGHVGIYRFEVPGDRIVLTLAPLPLATPVHALLTAGAAVTVPAEDADEFLTQHLPRLLRHAAVEAPGIDLPAPERPMLVVTARFSPAHRLDFALAWRYGDREPVPVSRRPLSDDRDQAPKTRSEARRAALARCLDPWTFAAAERSRGSTPPSSRRGCCRRSRRSPTSRSRSTASVRATAN